MTWTVEHRRAPAAVLHDPEEIDRRKVLVMEPAAAALVLGRAQPVGAEIDADIDVVRRSSGGGAVWVEPGGQVWIDILLPRGDALWDDDVNRAAWWVGEAWAAALADAGVDAIEVHRGPHRSGPWGRQVCFAGLGAGEVTVAGRKAVGVAQRRTRAGVRFQCAVLLRWHPARLARLLGLPVAAGAELEGSVWTLDDAGLDPGGLIAGFEKVLPPT